MRFVSLRKSNIIVDIEIDTVKPPDFVEQRFEVFINNDYLGTWTFCNRVRLSFIIPASQVRFLNHLLFRSAITAVPAKYGASRDQRQLSVALFNLEIRALD